MINTTVIFSEVTTMPKSKQSYDVWDDIIDSLVLEMEPPTQYIKDAIVVTKSGASYRLSATDFAELVAKEKTIPPEQSDIQHCSLSINFTKIKRDVNKFANAFISTVEKTITPIDVTPTKKVVKKVVNKKSKTVVTNKKSKTVVTNKKRKID